MRCSPTRSSPHPPSHLQRPCASFSLPATPSSFASSAPMCIDERKRSSPCIRYHVAPQDVHMTEQINKDSGAPQGARDLTWSYGTVLGAMSSRKTLVDMMQEMSQQ